MKTTLKVPNIVDAASGMHIAIQIADQTAETIWRAVATGWLRWAGSPRCLRVDPHRSQIAQGVLRQNRRTRHICGTQHLLKHTGRWDRWKTMPGICDKWDTEFVEDIVSESDFQTLLDELTDAKNFLVQHNGYMPRQWVFGLIPRVPGHLLEENSDLPNLDPEGSFQKDCRDAPISVEWRRSRLRRMRKSERV